HGAFSSDGRLLYCALNPRESQGALAVVDAQSGKQLGLWHGFNGDALAIALSPDGGTLASGGEDRHIHLWDAHTQAELARWQAHDTRITSLTFSPDGDTLVSGSEDGSIKLWDLPSIRRELAAIGLDW
ncbi:MAG TPA: WD40 repeat domain-containing protein, partial [Gemmataceae bacterium]|nr:WD40 repeat domain-containing protein [Gemmataceae bacterium]